MTREEYWAKERPIPRCQYGVYDPTAYEDGYAGDCGWGSVAYLWWGDDEKNGMYVCEKHYDKIRAEEEQSCIDCANCKDSSSPTYYICWKRGEPTIEDWWCDCFIWKSKYSWANNMEGEYEQGNKII